MTVVVDTSDFPGDSFIPGTRIRIPVHEEHGKIFEFPAGSEYQPPAAFYPSIPLKFTGGSEINCGIKSLHYSVSRHSGDDFLSERIRKKIVISGDRVTVDGQLREYNDLKTLALLKSIKNNECPQEFDHPGRYDIDVVFGGGYSLRDPRFTDASTN